MVAPAAERLSERLVAALEGKESTDAYVRGVRRDMGDRQKARPFQMLLAIAYEIVVTRKRPASDATAALHEAVALIESWAEEVERGRVELPDLTPALRLEARREGLDQEVSLEAATHQDDPTFLKRVIESSRGEIAANEQVVEVATRRLVLLENGRGQ